MLTMKYRKRIQLSLIVSAIGLFFATNSQGQIKVMAAPVKIKTVAKKSLSTPTNIPTTDSTNIYNSFFNDESDDLMENHPADDIYNEKWSSASIKYNIPSSKLPETFIVDCSNFKMPLDMSKGRISSKYGARWSRFHHGIDIAIPTGNDIYAAFDGEVRIVKYNRRGYGHYVVIRHNNGLETVYGHLQEPLCVVNQRVKAGDVIGLSGNTGRSTGPHLHFETRFVGNSFNPSKLINFKKREVHAQYYTLKKGKDFYSRSARAKARKFAKYYRVRRGDCLGKIARKHRTTVKRIKHLNGMRNSRIKIGQRIRIR